MDIERGVLIMGNFSFDFGFVKSGAPIVTISSLGLAFNYLSRSLLKFPEKINVGYDENAHAIGIRAHKENSGLSNYEFESRVKNDWIRIGCKDFVKYLSATVNIDFTKAKQFIAEYDEATKTLIVIVDESHMKK